MDLSLLNQYFQSLINQLLPEPQASLLKGLLLGVKELPKELDQALKVTGTIHVVVVSGYNISLVGGLFLKLSGLLKRQQAIFISLVSIVIYTFLVGPEPPVVRSAIMASVSYLGVWLGRQRLALFSLLMAASVMLVFDLSILGNISFQLSFLATLGIVIFADYFNAYLSKVPEPFRESLAVTLAAQLLVVPVIFYHFGTLSLISPLVNALVLWTIPIATILGLVSLTAASVFFPLGQLLAWIVWAPLTIFIQTVKFFAQFPLSQIELSKNSWIMAAGWYLMAFSIWIAFKTWEDRRRDVQI